MKKKQRFLFTLLMAIVMMAMSPMKMWADDLIPLTADKCTGLGLDATTYTGYYAIGSSSDLTWFRDKVNNDNSNFKEAKAVLTANIDMSSVCHAASEGVAKANWTPIGNSTYPYAGTFDGNGKTVEGLYYDGDDSGISFIGQLRNGGIVSSNNNSDYTGGIVGNVGDGTLSISNCCNLGDVSGGQYVGGIIGVCQTTYNVTVNNVYCACSVSGSSQVGAFVGALGYVMNMGSGSDYIYANATFTNCYYDNTKCTLNYCSDNNYNNKSGSDVSVTGKSTEAFASGEVAYLLNGSRSEGTTQSPLVWYQNIGISGDSYPVLKKAGDGSNTVYCVDKKNCAGAVTGKTYSNTNAAIVEAHNFQSGECTKCGAVQVSTYDELTSAINNGKTSIVVTADITSWSKISLSNKTLEIDFGGHMIDVAGSDERFYLNSCNLTIKNLTDSKCNILAKSLAGCTLTLTGCNISSTSNLYYDMYTGDSQINIDGCTLSSNGDSNGIFYRVGKINFIGESTISNGSESFIKKVDYVTSTINVAGGYKLINSSNSDIDITTSPYDWGTYIKVVSDATQCAKGSHTISLVTTSQPTCTTAGSGNYHCSTCNKNYTDTQGTWLATSTVTIPALGHAFVEDADNHRVSCSRTDCTFEAPMLTEGANTGLTYAANSTSDRNAASGYTTLYYFKATGTGTLIVTDSGDDGSTSDDTYGALFNADMSSTLRTDDSGNSSCFKLTYNVTEGQVYWIGARSYYSNTEIPNHTLTITGEWPHPIASATITDDEEYDGSLANKQAATFTYKRKFYDNDWNCLYVPFKADVTAFTDCDIYTINMFQEHDTDGDGVLDALTLEVNKAVSGKILANHPYLIKYKGELTADEKTNGKEVTIEMSNILLQAAKTPDFTCSSMSTNYTFTGTYSAIEASTATAGNYYSLVVDNTGNTVLGTTTTGVKAQRWYMTMSSRDSQLDTSSSSSNNAPIRIVVQGEEETGIEEVSAFESQLSGKFVENGRVVIVRNGKKYGISGQSLR